MLIKPWKSGHIFLQHVIPPWFVYCPTEVSRKNRGTPHVSMNKMYGMKNTPAKNKRDYLSLSVFLLWGTVVTSAHPRRFCSTGRGTSTRFQVRWSLPWRSGWIRLWSPSSPALTVEAYLSIPRERILSSSQTFHYFLCFHFPSLY